MKQIYNTDIVNYLNKEVSLYGFVANKRNLGKKAFIDLRDETGIAQVVLDKEQIGDIKKEYVLKVTGIVVERVQPNNELVTGKFEVVNVNVEVLGKSRDQLPFVIKDDVDAKEELRLENRFIDLRRNKMQQNIRNRYKLVKSIRDYLDNKKFVEIETPYLSKSTPEGARDFLVPTRSINRFFALPQSPQLYKQLLMASGFERYFQIARNFRDEDSRSDRQPEFTQLDMEIAFSDEKGIKKLIEGLFTDIWAKFGKDKPEFTEMDYDFAMDNYGSDKPDTRFKNSLKEVTKYFKDSEFKICAKAESVKAIFFEKEIDNKSFKILEEVAKKNGAKGLLFGNFNGKTGPAFRFIPVEIEKIAKDLNIKALSVFIVADNYDATVQSLGAVRVKLNEIYKLAENRDEFIWINNWPLFEKTEDGVSSAHHPFTSPQIQDLDLLDSKKDLLKIKARAYDLVLNGFEIGGGSIRINNIDIQRKIFKVLNLTDEQVNDQFGFFLRAFEYGLPPHGGIAFGIDRIAMLMNNETSIREVIAFPKNSHGYSPLEEAPSAATKKQLEEYHLEVKEDA